MGRMLQTLSSRVRVSSPYKKITCLCPGPIHVPWSDRHRPIRVLYLVSIRVANERSWKIRDPLTAKNSQLLAQHAKRRQAGGDGLLLRRALLVPLRRRRQDGKG